MLLAELVAAHSELELTALAAHSAEGKAIASYGASHGLSASTTGTTFTSVERALADLRGGDLAFLATPAEVSATLAPTCVRAGARVVDLSGAFRLNPNERAQAYPGLKDLPSDIQRAAYGLPELFRNREHVSPSTQLVANPGCYATAAALALAPLFGERAQGNFGGQPMHVAINALSGVTGAGRSGREDLSFAELSEDARVYRVLTHQHTPEIELALHLAGASEPPRVRFTPTLVPMRRGILLTATVFYGTAVSAEKARQFFTDAYANEAFVQVLAAPEEVRVRQVVGTNLCHIGVTARDNCMIVVAALDNLVKGAVGQAIQNANRLLGVPESAGLLHLRGFGP